MSNDGDDQALVKVSGDQPEPRVEQEGPNGDNFDQGGRTPAQTPSEHLEGRISRDMWAYINYSQEDQERHPDARGSNEGPQALSDDLMNVMEFRVDAHDT